MASGRLVLISYLSSITLVLSSHVQLKPEMDPVPLVRRDESRQASAALAEIPHGSVQASQQTPDPAKDAGSLGTIVLLLDTENEAEIQSLDESLVPSLVQAVKFRTPVTVLYSGPREPAEGSTVKLKLNPNLAPVTLVDVTQRVDSFAQEHAQKYADKKGGKAWKMNEFWLVHASSMPEFQHFSYAWHLSPKSELQSDVTTNLYEVMHKEKAAFGYRLLRNNHLESCKGLQHASQVFFQSHKDYKPSSLPSVVFLDMYETAQCPIWSSDFQLVNLDFIRGNKAYEDYVTYLADMGGFAKNGWGVANVQSIFLAHQAEPEKLLCMTPWVSNYKGEYTSELSCSSTKNIISFFQDSLKDSLARHSAMEALQISEGRKTNFTDVNQMLKDSLKDEVPANFKDEFAHKLAMIHKAKLAKAHPGVWHRIKSARVLQWRIIALGVLLAFISAVMAAIYACRDKWTKTLEQTA